MTTRDTTFNSSAQTLYEDVQGLFSVHRLNRQGVLDISNSVATFRQLQLRSAQEQDTEQTQIALSSDAPKLYAFGRQHRVFNYQAFLADSAIEKELTLGRGVNQSVWTGESYSEWQDFYENYARLSVCAANRWAVRFSYAGTIVTGAINMMAVTAFSQQPHIYDVAFSMYATAVQDVYVK